MIWANEIFNKIIIQIFLEYLKFILTHFIYEVKARFFFEYNVNFIIIKSIWEKLIDFFAKKNVQKVLIFFE